MNKKVMLTATICCLLMFASSTVLAQGTPDPAQPAVQPTKFGVGFQSSWPSYGISGQMNINDQIAVQGILGFLGVVNTYAGRGLYRFSQDEFWNAYGFGSVGAFSYEGIRVTTGFQLENTRETVPGFGAGVGIEYDWRAFAPGLPPVFWNLEIGLGLVNFKQVDYNFSALMFGGGAHFRF